MSGLKSQALWLLFSNFFSAILQIIQISVLARHLELHELGVLAIVNSILMIAMILQDMGMSSYIVHKQNLTRNEYYILGQFPTKSFCWITRIYLCIAFGQVLCNAKSCPFGYVGQY